MSATWITAFLKQCFVTFGVSLNSSATGLVMGFAASLLVQLREPGSTIPIDDSSASWIAAIPAFFLFLGNFLAIPIMEKYGRRTASLISIALLIVTWTAMIFISDLTSLLLSRAVQGISLGMSTTVCSLLIGEYTSPKVRGAFLMTISVSITIAIMAVHTLGSWLRWQTGAIVCAAIAVIDFIIVILSPESPSWLASQGRYDDCRRVFRWLRGDGEEEELTKMIESSIIVNESKVDANISETTFKKLKKSIVYLNTTIKRREFHRPVIIMIHIYTMALWGGVNFVVVYGVDLFHVVVGDIDVPLQMVILDGQRIVANILAVYIVQKIKRRTMLFVTVGMNIATLLVTAVYSYAKANQALLFDHPMIGILLIHCLLFAITTGITSLSYIIAGEIFPLEFKNLAGGISVLVFSFNLFVTLKTIPYCITNFGIHGSFCLNALVMGYSMLVVWVMLPETKDRTLQDIEDEFRGRLAPQELKSAQPLTSWKRDRRCSSHSIT